MLHSLTNLAHLRPGVKNICNKIVSYQSTICMRERELSKEELLQVTAAIKRGEKEEFRKILDGYRNLVYHIVSRIIPYSSDWEDLYQDIFIKIYRNLNHFRYEGRFSTWVGTIAYNTCLNRIKKKKETLLGNNLQQTAQFDQQSPDRHLQDKVRQSAVRLGLAKLSPAQRLAITLYHLDELGYEEIAKIMNIPAGTVKSHLHRGRIQLKKILLEEYAEEIP